MRKSTLLFTCLFALALTSKAQIDVTINPINFLLGSYGLAADFALSENFSVEPAISFAARTVNGDDIGEYRLTGLPVQANAKYYFNPTKSANKFYAMGFLRYVNRTGKYTDESFASNFTQNRFGIGFGAGFKVVGDNNLVFDFGGGYGRSIVDNTKFDDEDSAGTLDLGLGIINLRVSIGYRFGG